MVPWTMDDGKNPKPFQFPFTNDNGELFSNVTSSPVADPAPATNPQTHAEIAAPATPAPRQSREQDAIKAYDDYTKEHPRPEATKPKFWQQLAAMGIGGMAGWTNAAGRVRHPLDPGPAQDFIQHPFLQQRQAEWDSHTAPMAQRIKLGHEADQSERATELEQAQAGAANARAVESQAKAERARRGTPDKALNYKDVAPEHTLYDPNTGQAVFTAPPSAGKPKEPAKPKTLWEALLSDDPEQVKRGQAGYEFETKTRGKYASDHTDYEGRDFRRQQQAANAADKVEHAKTTEEDRLWGAYHNELGKLLKTANDGRNSSGDPEFVTKEDLLKDKRYQPQVQSLNGRYQKRFQNVQDGYARSVRSAPGGGQAEDWQVGPDLQYSKRGAAPPSAPAATGNGTTIQADRVNVPAKSTQRQPYNIHGKIYSLTEEEFAAAVAEDKRERAATRR
jgi:hypothetical protein